MNIKNIKSLVQIMENSGLTSIEVAEGDTKIRLEKNAGLVGQPVNTAAAPVSQGEKSDNGEKATANEAVDFNHITEIKSPMVGVFYRSPSPDAKPYVEVGSKVKKGDVLCIIEAMKLMNEILAETDGEIVDICAVNGEVVEFSQVLFKIF